MGEFPLILVIWVNYSVNHGYRNYTVHIPQVYPASIPQSLMQMQMQIVLHRLSSDEVSAPPYANCPALIATDIAYKPWKYMQAPNVPPIP